MLNAIAFAGSALLALCVAARIQAETKLGHADLQFATVEQARELLTARDDFIERLSPFDRAARLKTDADVTEQEYLGFVARNAMDWSDAEREKLQTIVAAVAPRIAALKLPLPPTIWLVRTTGAEEGGAAYTRGAAIVFPTRPLGGDAEELKQVFCHELFHVLSRANPELQQSLYRTIGYEKCNELALPADLAPRKITNPDAPRIDQCIKLTLNGEQRWAVPILYASSDKYDPRRGGDFFRYLKFRFMAVERAAGGAVTPIIRGGQPLLVVPSDVRGLFEQIGRNTQYIIHPEEVVADNFAALVTEKKGVESPDVLLKIEQVLNDRAAKSP